MMDLDRLMHSPVHWRGNSYLQIGPIDHKQGELKQKRANDWCRIVIAWRCA